MDRTLRGDPGPGEREIVPQKDPALARLERSFEDLRGQQMRRKVMAGVVADTTETELHHLLGRKPSSIVGVATDGSTNPLVVTHVGPETFKFTCAAQATFDITIEG